MDSAVLPESLWCDGAIRISPAALAAAWRQELVERDLLERAGESETASVQTIGGEGIEETRFHFARRFVASAARVSYLMLASEGRFSPVPRNVLAMLFDGSLAVLDIPSGSGGGLLGLLSAVQELRRQRILPLTPIRVKICAGDISPHALEIHASMLKRMKPYFEAVGIRLEWTHKAWDVSDPLSTSELLDNWLNDTALCEEHLVFVSAFSGFAKHHFNDVNEAVRHIAVRPHNKMLQFVWIEPDSNEGRWLLGKLFDVFMDVFRKRDASIAKCPQPAKFSWIHPLTGNRINGNVRIIALERSAIQ